MTAVVDESCTTITISSTDFHTSNLSNTLTVTINGTDYTIDVPTTTTSSFVIDADALDLTELPIGVYSIKLVNVLADSSTATASLCRVLLCGEECNVIPLYENLENLDKVLAFEALKYINICGECSCLIATSLYNTYTDTDDDTNCNCK